MFGIQSDDIEKVQLRDNFNVVIKKNAFEAVLKNYMHSASFYICIILLSKQQVDINDLITSEVSKM